MVVNLGSVVPPCFTFPFASGFELVELFGLPVPELFPEGFSEPSPCCCVGGSGDCFFFDFVQLSKLTLTHTLSTKNLKFIGYLRSLSWPHRSFCCEIKCLNGKFCLWVAEVVREAYIAILWS